MKPIINMWLFMIFFLIQTTAHADVNSDLNSYFDGLGMVTNVTSPRALQGQQAGYYSGGSLIARSSVRNVQLAQIELPSFKAGCGGIDVFMGGLSHVNHEKMVELMRNIMNNAKGYAFKLTLAQVSPLLKNVMSEMQDVADRINQMNINSCETAENIVGGLWPKTRAAQQQVCQDIGSNSGMFRDWAESRQKCTSATGEFNEAMRRGDKSDTYKNMIFDEGNLVWNALKNYSFASNDDQFKELLMSLSGSIVIRKAGRSDGNGNENNVFETISSLASDASLFKAILYGDKATIYKCNDHDKCLGISKQNIVIQKDTALVNRVSKMLRSISQKIMTEEKLNDEERGLIEATHIPIYKILNVQAAYQKSSNILDVESYSDVIATDILFQYLQENLEIVRVSSRTLHYPAEIMAQFHDGINVATSHIREEQRKTQHKISMTIQLIEQAQVLEKMLAGQLSQQLGNSLTWARSLR